MNLPTESGQLRSWSKHLEQAELYIYVATAFVLLFAAVGLLLFGLYEMALRLADGDYLRGLLHLLDRALLVLMLAEIIYTVSRVARKLRLEVEPFLIVGVIAAIRRMLIITAESATHVDITDPAFLAALAELGLLALVILVFAVAMRLLRMEGDDVH
jgi:uncharacterized membrane protein (DUF373 family)